MEDCDSSLGKLDKLTTDEVNEILESYNAFCNATQSLLLHDHLSFTTHQFVSHVHTLSKHGLQSLLTHHFLNVLEVRSYSTNHFTLSVYKFNLFHFLHYKVWIFIDPFGCRKRLSEMGYRDSGSILFLTLVWTRMTMWVFVYEPKFKFWFLVATMFDFLC